MKNVLKWTNRTPAPFTINIYRGAAELDRKNLSNPIVTLTGGESTYSDEVPRGSTNYYVIEVVKGTDKATSNNIQVLALPKKGPGPITLLQGDYNYGYFGTIASKDFISTITLVSTLNITFNAAAAVAHQAPLWHKYIRNGKILYIPNGPLYRAVNWKTVYDNGLVYGVDGTGPTNAGTPVLQNRKVVINGSTFRVRLMTGYDDNLSNLPPAEAVSEALYPYPNEWNDLVYPLFEYAPTLQRMANVTQQTAAQLNLGGTGGLYHLLQERISATGSIFVAGAPGAGRNPVAGRNNQVINGTGSNACGWWPVLELVEE